MPKGLETEKGPRLVSVSKDRHVAIFDLGASSVGEGLKLIANPRIEQTAVPTAILPHPKTNSKSSDHMVIIANSQFKLKLYNNSTFMCRKTALGPVYGGALTRYVDTIWKTREGSIS